MATDFNTNAIASGGGFKPSSKDTPIDVRSRVNTETDILEVPNPYVGMIIYVIDTGKRFEVLSINDVQQGLGKVSRIDQYRELPYADKEYVDKAIANAQLNSGNGESVNLEGYAKTSDIPTKVSQLENDNDFVTEAEMQQYVTENVTNVDAYQEKEDEDLETEDKTIVGAINELKNTTDNIMVINNPFKGKKANFLGDSNTMMNKNWRTRAYVDYVKDALGLSVANNYGRAGSTITPLPGKDTTSFLYRYKQMDADADLIVVMGGVNDVGQNSELGKFGDTETTTFYGAMEALCDGLMTKYPGKTIIFVTPIEQLNPSMMNSNTTGYTVADFANAIKMVCSKYSIPVLDAYSCSGIYAKNAKNAGIYLIADKLHLNDAGCELIARKVTNFLLFGALNTTILIEGKNNNGGESGDNTDPEEPEKTVSVQSVELDKHEATMNVNDVIELIPNVLPENATNKGVTWKASNSNASVSGGMVTALKSGSCAITVTTNEGGFTDTCNITINDEAGGSGGVVDPSTYVISGKKVENTKYQASGTKYDFSVMISSENIQNGDTLVLNYTLSNLVNIAESIPAASRPTWSETIETNKGIAAANLAGTVTRAGTAESGTITISINANNANNYEYLKIPMTFNVTDKSIPCSFTIDTLSVSKNGINLEIVNLGCCFVAENTTVTDI